MSAPLNNDTPVWLAGVNGPGHRAGISPKAGVPPKGTACGQRLAGMIRTTLVAVHVAGLPWCPRCFPESVRMPGWPLNRRRSS